jgi:general secretion pathway protein K
MRCRQSGAAIVTAMLTVMMVAVLASAMLWQQWRGYEVEAAQRTRVQSNWILGGALDWARLILREDARQGGADTLSEPWAVPLAPARLSDFLAAERGQSLVADETDPSQEAFLSGAMDDQQARLNVRNLIDGDQLSATGVAAWMRLYDLLGLPESELLLLSQNLRAASAKTALSAGQGRPLWPQELLDLRWLGVSPTSLGLLAPFVTILPASTPVNLNTAPAEVLVAAIDGLDMAQAQNLVRARARQPFNTLADAEKLISDAAIKLDTKLHSTSSRYFGVTGVLRIGQTVVQERSWLQRDGVQVRALRRHRGLYLAQPTTTAAPMGNGPPLQ